MASSSVLRQSFVILCLFIVLTAGVGPLDLTSAQNPLLTGEPRIVDPGPPRGPPADAIVLFDGKDLSQWLSVNGGPPKWTVKDGVLTVGSYTGNISSKQDFGDVQLHLEWATPAEVTGEGQGRGNSGVFFMGRYEVQILDSYKNPTYYDGQAAAIYKQYPPLVNVSRRPGEWQTYDIIFHAPAFDEEGKVKKRARISVLHNGVLVQDNVELTGPTSLKGGLLEDRPEYTKHSPKAPLVLQDHHNPIRFRNIWVRPL